MLRALLIRLLGVALLAAIGATVGTSGPLGLPEPDPTTTTSPVPTYEGGYATSWY